MTSSHRAVPGRDPRGWYLISSFKVCQKAADGGDGRRGLSCLRVPRMPADKASFIIHSLGGEVEA